MASVIGHDQGEGGQPDVRHELGEHLLGAVGRGRDAVGRQNPERTGPAQPLRRQLLGDQGRPEQLVLQPVAAALGDALGHRPGRRHRSSGRAGAPVAPSEPGRAATPGVPSAAGSWGSLVVVWATAPQ